MSLRLSLFLFLVACGSPGVKPSAAFDPAPEDEADAQEAAVTVGGRHVRWRKLELPTNSVDCRSVGASAGGALLANCRLGLDEATMAFVWKNAMASPKMLPVPPRTNSYWRDVIATHINASGTIVGNGQRIDMGGEFEFIQRPHALRWTPNAHGSYEVEELVAPVGDNDLTAVALNDAGDILVSSVNYNTGESVQLLTGSVFTLLTPYAFGSGIDPSYFPSAMNNARQAFFVRTSSSDEEILNGGVVSIFASANFYSAPVDINNVGTILSKGGGTWTLQGGVWTVHSLALPSANTDWISAADIAEDGTIAGLSHTNDPNEVFVNRVAVWTPAGVPIDLGPVPARFNPEGFPLRNPEVGAITADGDLFGQVASAGLPLGSVISQPVLISYDR